MEQQELQEQLEKEFRYLNISKERLAYVKKIEIEIFENKKTKLFLNDDERIAYQYNLLEVDDAKTRVELCEQRIKNLKTFEINKIQLNNE